MAMNIFIKIKCEFYLTVLILKIEKMYQKSPTFATFTLQKLGINLFYFHFNFSSASPPSQTRSIASSAIPPSRMFSIDPPLKANK